MKKQDETQNEDLEIDDKQKITAVFALMPVFADFMQDLEEKGFFTSDVRQKHTKNLIYKIRKFDEFLINSAPKEATDNQVDIQRWFRNAIKQCIG